MNDTVLGKCSCCGGLVMVPGAWAGILPPRPTCSSCGAVAEDTPNLPVIPTTRRPQTPSKGLGDVSVWEEHEACDFCGKHVDDCGHDPFWSLT